MPKCILIIDDHDDLATELSEAFVNSGFDVSIGTDWKTGSKLASQKEFDVTITDLDGATISPVPAANGKPMASEITDVVSSRRSNLKAFKLCFGGKATSIMDEDEVVQVVRTTLSYKARYIDRGSAMLDRHELIEFEVPSSILLMHDILDYLMKRVEKNGVVKPERSNLFVALDEAFVNAVKHGNKFDVNKYIKISVEISPERAQFTIEDEGEGFNVNEIPDPTDPENMFRSSGRGVMFIYNIMDEVKYNARGNRLTMIKKSEREA